MGIVFDRDEVVTPPGGPGLAFRQVGTGPAFVVLHGGSGSWSHWVRNIAILAERFTVVLPDLPGFGDSGDFPRRAPAEDYVDVVTRAVNLWLGEQVSLHMAGFSFGGMIAAGWAARLGARIRRITLLAPSGFGPLPGPPLDLRKPEEGMTPDQVRGVYRHNLAELMLNNPAAITEEAITLHQRNLERSRFRNRHLSRAEFTEDYLKQIPAPLQLIYGEHDAPARPAVQSRLDRVLAIKPDTRTHIIPNCGHWAQYEQPEAINRLLLDFHGEER